MSQPETFSLSRNLNLIIRTNIEFSTFASRELLLKTKSKLISFKPEKLEYLIHT